MSKLSAFFAVVVCTGAAAQSLPDDASASVLFEGSTLPPTVLASARTEIQSLIAPAGIKLSWVSSEAVENVAVQGQLVIIHFRGTCRPDAFAGRAPAVPTEPDGEALGQTHLADGKVLPIADILCDSIRAVVDRDLRLAPPETREALLGRALGRVTGHELYHVLLQSTDHGHEGLSRAKQSSADLLAPSRPFSAADERRIAASVDADAPASGR